jgi:hypothetical protein
MPPDVLRHAADQNNLQRVVERMSGNRISPVAPAGKSRLAMTLPCTSGFLEP